MWDWFIAKIILISQKYLFRSYLKWQQNSVPNLTRSLSTIFCGWDVQTMWNLQKNMWCMEKHVLFFKMGLPLEARVKKTICGVEAHWLFGKEKILRKSASVNRASNCQLIRKNSAYLLNNLIYIYIYIYIYIHTQINLRFESNFTIFSLKCH